MIKEVNAINKREFDKIINIELSLKDLQMIRDALWNVTFNDINQTYNDSSIGNINIPYNNSDLSNSCDILDEILYKNNGYSAIGGEL